MKILAEFCYALGKIHFFFYNCLVNLVFSGKYRRKVFKTMNLSNIEDIIIEYDKDNEYSRFGLLPLIIWYFKNVLELEKRFNSLTVKSKRNHANPIKYRKKPYTEEKMSLAFIVLVLLQIERFSKHYCQLN